MARPDLTYRRAGVLTRQKPRGLFAGWREERERRRAEAQEEASRLITNKLAENELQFIRKLESIDFRNSRLPAEVLQKKSDPNQPYGDLEYAARAIVSTLRKHPQVIKMDIRKFDEKLMTLVLLFKQAVEHGDERAAYAAKGGIVRGVAEIRSRIPQNQPELATQFVEANTNYLEQWITLVSMAQAADRMNENAKNQREICEDDVKREEAETEKLRKALLADEEKLIAFEKLLSYSASTDRSNWTPVERQVHKEMLEKRLARVHTQLSNALLLQSEQDLAITIGNLEILYAKVASLEIVVDPNLMEKFKESVDQLFQKLADSDARMEETLKFMDEIEGRLKQLDEAPGARRAREVVAEQAAQEYAKIQEKQNYVSNANAVAAAKLRKDLNLLDDETLRLQKEQAEREQQRLLDEMREELMEQAREQVREQEIEVLTVQEEEVERELIPN